MIIITIFILRIPASKWPVFSLLIYLLVILFIFCPIGVKFIPQSFPSLPACVTPALSTPLQLGRSALIVRPCGATVSLWEGGKKIYNNVGSFTVWSQY